MSNKNLNRLLVFLLLLWIFISAFYYVGNFITGEVLADRSSNTLHKVLKYVVVMVISVVAMISVRAWTLFVFYGCLLIFLMVLALVQATDTNVLFAIDLLVVFISFVGLILIFSHLGNDDLRKVIYCVVLSGVMAAFGSYFEYWFMEPILGDYWRNTGGYRSISTLLNPNNLGEYMGAAILLLVKSDIRIRYRSVVLIILASSLFMSGSRTAVVALSTMIFVTSVFSGNGNIRIKNFIGWSVFLLAITAAFLLAINYGGIPDRMTNFETAAIRINKYLEFIFDVNTSYLFPDFQSVRIDMVSENAYFHLFNAFGALFFLLFIGIVFSFIEVRRFDLDSKEVAAFRTVFWYYLVASCFENVFMSFPNNQLLFASAGCVFCIRRYQRSRFVHATS